MNRRSFLLATYPLVVSRRGLCNVLFPDEAREPWRAFELTTRVEILNPVGPTRVWVPTPAAGSLPFQKALGNTLVQQGGHVLVRPGGPDDPGLIFTEFPPKVPPVLIINSRIATRNWSVDLIGPARIDETPRQELKRYLQPTRYVPTDDIVKRTAQKITSGLDSDERKARAIYEWVIENTFRNPKTLGCGRGDIRGMLRTGDLGGKCADINGLFVGLARAAEIPARDVYGIRLCKSKRGFVSLGPTSENVTKSQHCRAEVYLKSYGWVPADPADVRKVMLEEPPGNRPPDDMLVRKAHSLLFGSWEMNWIAYNFSQDVTLPKSTRTLPFFMYPQASTDAGWVDSQDPQRFKYEMTARELTSEVF